ncbi:hypothetical protein C621_0209285 [Bacillus thuringiensis serovar aizawai str. Leapi01]|nr:hypothetical protein C621_0209285 [Bacillus thuringiensis serovar aizawai str. Leapi01]ETE95122.1 hypothetical protein C623_0223050 [Bacillus thuringiensis serovar aizawai str. Hu4-2]
MNIRGKVALLLEGLLFSADDGILVVPLLVYMNVFLIMIGRVNVTSYILKDIITLPF